MQHINRREIIKTTGAGAGIALGASAASGNETAVTSSDTVESDQNVVSTVGATAQSAEIAIDVEPSEFANNPDAVLQEINTGEPLVEIPAGSGEIADDGTLTVPGDQVNVPDLIDVLLALDPKQFILDFINGLDIYEDIINELDLIGDIQDPLIDFILQVDFGDNQVTAIENILGVLNTEFNLGLPLDILPIDTILQDPENGIPELLSAIAFLVDEVDSIETTEDLVLGVVGLINQLVIEDPANELAGPEDLLPWIAGQVEAVDLSNFLSLLNVTVIADPIEGTVDPSLDPLLIDIPLEGPTLEVALDIENSPVDPVQIQFDQLSLTLTTGESGNLAGSFNGDTSTDTATATAVDNQFTANITEFNLLELVNKLDLVQVVTAIFDIAGINPADYPDFEISQFVSNLDLPSIVENANLLELLAGLITDEPGRHGLRATLDMTFSDLQAVFDDVAVGPPPLPPFSDPPTDPDGDGTYEDVDGDGSFDIFDVQAFFNNFTSDPVQNNLGAFNFSGADPPEVTIFDVQALFEKLQDQES